MKYWILIPLITITFVGYCDYEAFKWGQIDGCQRGLHKIIESLAGKQMADDTQLQIHSICEEELK